MWLKCTIFKWNYLWSLELTWLASSIKGKKRRKNRFLRMCFLSEWGSYLIGSVLIFLWVDMEMRLQGRPDSRVFKQKRQSGRYFSILFLFFELGWSHLSFFRILFIPEKCRPGNSCQGQKERKKNISNCLIMQWAGSVQTHVVWTERLHEISSMTIIQVVPMILPLCLEFLFDLFF